MRWRLVTLLGLLVSSVAQAQIAPYRSVRVRSCPYADTLLGPMKDDFRGSVRGFYHKERDSTYYVTGEEGKRPSVTSSLKHAGKGPVRDLAIQMAVFLRGGQAQLVSAASEKGPVDVTFLVDDSVTVAPASTALGRFEGPKEMITLPASALLEGADLLTVARAQRIVMNAGPLPVKITNDERRDLRALVRVAVCSQ